MDLEEHKIPVSPPEGVLEMEFTAYDCRRAFSSILREEKLLEKKKRWLISSMKMRNTSKRLRSHAFEDMYLSESLARGDDGTLQDIKMFVERCFRSSSDKRIDKALLHLGDIEEGSSPDSVEQSKFDDQLERVDMLFRTLSHITSLNPVSSSLTSSISKILDGLEALPSLALIAIDRKLRDVAFRPQFPATCSCKREILVDRLRKRCYKLLLTMGNGSQLPSSLAKALSVIFLSVKLMTRKALVMKTNLFHFTPVTDSLQNEILQAIWSLPNIKYGKLKEIQHVIAPNVNLPSKALRGAIHKYLMEHLFHCDEQHVSKAFLLALKLINKGTRCHLRDEVSEEFEAILNVSSHLRQFVWDLFPDDNMEQEFANAFVGGYIGNECENNIIIDENEDCSTFGYSDYLSSCERDDHVEGTGDSIPATSNKGFNSENCSFAQLFGAQKLTCNVKVESDQIGSFTESSHRQSSSNPSNRYLAVQKICDQTSLVAYKLIGHLLEELVQNESNQVGGAALHLTGDAPSMPNCQVPDVATVLSEHLQSAIREVIGE